MIEFQPFLIVLAALAFAATLAAIVVQRWRTFSGYPEVREEVQRIAKMLKAEVSREGADLLVQGNHAGKPVTLRFSREDDAPGLSIRMGVPSNFEMSVFPQSGSAAKRGKARVRANDRVFDSAFAVWSNQPVEAKLFLSLRGTIGAIKRICHSPHTFLNIVPGVAEAGELTLAPANLADRVLTQLGYLRELSEMFMAMPGVDNIKVLPHRKKPGSKLARVAVVAGLTIALGLSLRLYGVPAPASELVPASQLQGVLAADAPLIANLDQWRPAREADYDPDAVAWLRSEGIPPSGRVTGDFSGKNNGRDLDVAYILKNDDDGLMRIVVLSRGKIIYDLRYRNITGAVRVPASQLNSIAWQTPLSGTADGDGLLVATRPGDRASGIVFAFHGQKLLLGVPVDYQRVSLF